MYTFTFTDNTTFNGGTIHNSLWNQIPHKPISQLIYNLCEKTFIFKDYQSYNHLIEKVNISGTEFITRILIMGKTGEKVDMIIFDLKQKKIFRQTAQFGFEYNNKPAGGWKSGTEGTLGVILTRQEPPKSPIIVPEGV